MIYDISTLYIMYNKFAYAPNSNREGGGLRVRISFLLKLFDENYLGVL